MSYSSLNKPEYSAEDLNAMTISQIRSLAGGLGYSLTKTLKADLITEFLDQQEGIVNA